MSQTKAQLIDPVDGSLVNADINASAAIAGTKISPDFGSQAITTTGTVNTTLLSSAQTGTGGLIKLARTGTANGEYLFKMLNDSGNDCSLVIRDEKAGASRFTIDSNGTVDVAGNLDVGAGLDVTGAITSTGTLTIENAAPGISLNDTNSNPDWQVKNENGLFRIRDITSSVNRLTIASGGQTVISGNLDCSSGVDVTGNITVTGTVDGVDIAALNTTVGNITTDLVTDTTPQLGGNLDTNSFEINFDDNHAANFGDSNDLKVLYTGSESRIDFSATAHNLKIMGSGGSSHIDLQPRNGHSSVKAIANGAAELYHDNAKRFETTNTGSTITGDLSLNGDIYLTVDDEKVQLGASQDFLLFHSGTANHVYGVTDYPLIFTTNNSEKMRLLSDGKFGIGLNNPNYLLDVTSGSGNAKFNLGRSNSAGANNAYGSIFFSNSSGTVMSSVRAHCESDNNNAYLAFTTTNSGNNAECARFSKTGRLMVNSTSNPTNNADGLFNGETSSGMDGINIKHSHGGQCVNLWRANGDGALINFARGNSSQTGVGSVTVNSNSTSYNTSSDYRLKENITTLSNGITRLKNLKPSRFNFIHDPDNTVDGFLAHEAMAVVPECGHGKKDEVVTQAMVDSGAYTSKKLGTPLYQGLDYGRITPLLTAALQEAIAKIETLETEVAALKAA